jgi:TolB-like protein
VAPFDVLSGDPQLAWLREGSVSLLSLDLAEWRDLRVVDYERGLDLLRDLGLDDARRLTLEDARRLARRADVWTVVMGQVTGTADSLQVVARLYDVATGARWTRRPARGRARATRARCSTRSPATCSTSPAPRPPPWRPAPPGA